MVGGRPGQRTDPPACSLARPPGVTRPRAGADRDSFQGFRSGNLNPLLYLLYNVAPGFYFHDINGAGQVENNNGFFPVVRGFDLATGIGTPRMDRLITLTF